MLIPSDRFSRDVLASLSDSERDRRLLELESVVNQELRAHGNLPQFQEHLYDIVEQLSRMGHFLGRWEYDSEIEVWGGKSYMDRSVEDELLLRSEFPVGVRFAWRDYQALNRKRQHP